MLSLRNRFGIPGVISVLALVFALVAGGAYAADNSGDGATASAKNRKGGGNVNKLIKREARKFSKVFSQRFAKRFPGPIGPQGFPGLPGAPGDDGDDGDDGSDGQNGADGADGADGKSVEVTELAAGECANEEGGAEVKQEGAAEGVEVCNGAEGSPWTDMGVLPEGETETGAWAYGKTSTGNINVAVSFNVPLAAPIAAGNAHYIYTTGEELVEGEPGEIVEVEPEHCPGSASAPAADPGHFCMYAAKQTGALGVSGFVVTSEFISDPGSDTIVDHATGTTGAHLSILLFSGSSEGWGTYAVTAP